MLPRFTSQKGQLPHLFLQKPISYINNLDTFISIFRMPCPCDNHFRIRIPDLQQWRIFSFKGFMILDVVADLYIYFLATFLRYKINLFLIQLPNIHIISPAKKFNAYHILINPAIIKISASKNSIPDTSVTKVKLLGTFQIPFPSYIVALYIVKNEIFGEVRLPMLSMRNSLSLCKTSVSGREYFWTRSLVTIVSYTSFM